MGAKKEKHGEFCIIKWFLDFTGDQGEVMIFYAAKFHWYGFTAVYTSWISHDMISGVKVRTRFSHVHFPEVNEKEIVWEDAKFGISGKWVSMAETICSRLYDSEEGFLDWNCLQPASRVKIWQNNKMLEGYGYAENLKMTVPAWKIPMHDLRWGRFISSAYHLVWIELREKEKKQWLWINGKRMNGCTIENEYVSVPELQLILELDRRTLLESEKKILKVTEKLVRFLPGFTKVVPLDFLMANEYKWLSNGVLRIQGNIVSEGKALHEHVIFKTC